MKDSNFPLLHYLEKININFKGYKSGSGFGIISQWGHEAV